MTVEEKLEHFTSLTVSNALKNSAETLDAIRENMDESFEKYRKERLETAKKEREATLSGLKRRMNREFTAGEMHIKRKYMHKQEELKNILFTEVERRLSEYRKTSDYPAGLVRGVKKAQELAGGEEVIIYLDKEDEKFITRIKNETGITALISDFPMGGGVRAHIPSKNLLMDDSYNTRLAEIRDKYVIKAE